ncbi:hypothetical protein ES702_02653 [subsurface metagenome]
MGKKGAIPDAAEEVRDEKLGGGTSNTAGTFVSILAVLLHAAGSSSAAGGGGGADAYR